MVPILLLLAGAADGPLVAPTPVIDLGPVRTGPALVFAFEVLHAGTGPLALRGVDTGCNCAKPELSATVLQPGQRATVTVRVNTLTPAAGPNRWRVGVRYRLNEAEADRTLELTAAATLVREVAVTPPGLAVSTAGAATLPLTVTDRRPTHLTVTGAAATSPHVTATVRPGAVVDGVWSQAVSVAVAATLPPGRHTETLVLTTTDPTMPELRVPVTVDKRPPQEVRAWPPAVTLSPGGTARVQRRRTTNQPLAVASTASDHPAVSAAVEGTGPTVTLTVSLGASAGASGEATVRVRLADPPGREVTVPVSWGGR
jgi:hypothetical protein